MFQDQTVVKFLRSELGKGPWTPERLQSIRRVSLVGSENPMELIPRTIGAKDLILDRCHLRQVPDLSAYPRLWLLYMCYMPLRSLEPLRDLPKLTVVRFESTPLTSLEPLESLPSLKICRAKGCPLDDASYAWLRRLDPENARQSWSEEPELEMNRFLHQMGLSLVYLGDATRGSVTFTDPWIGIPGLQVVWTYTDTIRKVLADCEPGDTLAAFNALHAAA